MPKLEQNPDRVRNAVGVVYSSRSTKSKANGKYELKSLEATDWIVTVSADGKVTVNVAVTIRTGEALTMDFVLVGV